MMSATKERSVIAKADIPSQLKLQFKILCAKQGFNMSFVSELLLRDWLLNKEPVLNDTVSIPQADLEVISVYIPESLKVQLKVICMQERVTMKIVLFQLIQNWVKAYSDKPFTQVPVLSANKTN